MLDDDQATSWTDKTSSRRKATPTQEAAYDDAVFGTEMEVLNDLPSRGPSSGSDMIKTMAQKKHTFTEHTEKGLGMEIDF